MYLGQRYLLYYPNRDLKSPEFYELINFKVKTFQTADGIKITTWYKDPNNKEMPIIVYFHGNAGHLGFRSDRFRKLSDAGFGILALSYRGYGDSEGTPSEEGFYNDARTIMDSVKEDKHKIIIYGESLGTGVATQMATEYKVSGLVLESPFTSVPDRAQQIYWWIPARFMVKDKFDNLSKIRSINNTPLLIIHGGKDTIVPLEHGKNLYNTAEKPRQFTSDENMGHSPELNDYIIGLIKNLPSLTPNS